MRSRSLSALAVVFGLSVLLVAGGCSNCCPNTPNCSPCATQPEPCAPPPCAPPPCAPVCEAPTPPPAANCGEVWCYIRIPAQTRTVCEQVCVQPASCRQEWVCPETREVEETICTKPEERRKIPVPAEYSTVSEQFCTCPAKCEWRRVDCQPHSLTQGEQVGECWRLMEIPAVYETRCHQVCTKPESCREECVPAQYATQKKTVTVREGYYKSIDVPAVFETRSHEECVAPARWEWRRTAECEVPVDASAATAPAPEVAPPEAPAPTGSADDTLPPAGGYTPPPSDSFSSGR